VGNTASSFFDNNYQAAKFPSHGMNIQWNLISYTFLGLWYILVDYFRGYVYNHSEICVHIMLTSGYDEAVSSWL
jgi:hypothetical protein